MTATAPPRCTCAHPDPMPLELVPGRPIGHLCRKCARPVKAGAK